MQDEFAIMVAKFAGVDQFLMSDFDGVELTLKVRFPEMQEFLEHREARRDVQLLPDIGLQQDGVIG